MILRYLKKREPLEFDIDSEISLKLKNISKILKIFFRKAFRDFYKFFQRKLLKPSLREKVIEIEKKILNTKENLENNFTQAIELKKNGYLLIENLFNEQQLDEINKFFSKDILLDPIYHIDKKFKISNLPADAITGYIPSEHIIKCPYIFGGANNEKLLKILKNYFNCKFKLDWIWSWWSFPSEKPIGPQLFHRDYESMNFLKVFVYLTDVDENNGPHEIIEGSHKIDKLFNRERFNDELVFKNFNEKQKKTIIGKKGTSIIANTFCIHRGVNPKQKERLVLSYLFSVVPSNRSPKIPVVKYSDLDPFSKSKIKNKSINNLFIDFT